MFVGGRKKIRRFKRRCAKRFVTAQRTCLQASRRDLGVELNWRFWRGHTSRSGETNEEADVYFVATDGSVLSREVVRENWKTIAFAEVLRDIASVRESSYH